MAEALSTPAPLPAPVPVRRPRRLLRRVGLGLAVLLGLLLFAVLAGGLWFRSRMEASLPQLAGEAALPGLAAAVEVERDALGVPTIRAASREDAARALGFLHAQDRFFQMDLLRRSAAGELAEIVGPPVVESDRGIRVHRFRHVAGQVVTRSNPEDRALLQAYTDGVNAGLSALGEKPFEYVLLGVEPAPWRPEDSILSVFAMFIDLQDEDGSNESELGFLHDTLPREMFEFLSLPGTDWDAPLEGEPFAVPPFPGPEVFDLRRAGAAPSLPKAARRAAPAAEPEWNEAVPGSNNWAVAGTHTAHGRALLANDMHLGIRVPNTWYRTSIVRPDGAGGTLRFTGVTLPGTPSIVVGSNGHVAWGFTNSYGDWSDVVLLEIDPRQPGLYRTPAGPKPFRTVKETIRVKGDDPVTLEVKETIWGPVIAADHRGRQRAFAWTAHHPQAVNLGIKGMESARTVEEAMAVANRSGIPAQNFVVADAAGRIGWTIMGRIPRRVGFTGRLPTSWADGSRRWDGWLAPEEAPRVVDPPSGRIWTANARVVAGEALAKLGDG
ncbi:penicillin acylase family protein, partial [bacterium]